MSSARFIAVSVLVLTSESAFAWSSPGHMTSGAIVYDELKSHSPQTLEAILKLMAHHPDRGSFEVAIASTQGEDRARRILMEMARWPDDIRGGSYDHPTWHYADRPLMDPDHPAPTKPRFPVSGEAIEAFALNATVITDTHAPDADRAIALCWLIHIVGDMHQPLHAADWRSATYPDGDRGGGLQFILDPQKHEPMSLHWYWDQAVFRSPDPDKVIGRARELEAKIPRPPNLQVSGVNRVEEFNSWVEESHALAISDGYTADLKTSNSESNPPALSPAYIDRSTRIAEQRLTLASYRLAALLSQLLAP
jgi:S1/P1 Nuclease